MGTYGRAEACRRSTTGAHRPHAAGRTSSTNSPSRENGHDFGMQGVCGGRKSLTTERRAAVPDTARERGRLSTISLAHSGTKRRLFQSAPSRVPSSRQFAKLGSRKSLRFEARQSAAFSLPLENSFAAKLTYIHGYIFTKNTPRLPTVNIYSPPKEYGIAPPLVRFGVYSFFYK